LINFLILRKVFTDFNQVKIVKNRDTIIGVIMVFIVIGVIVALTSTESDVIVVEDVLDKELSSVQETSPEIQERLDEIEKINLENEYKPKEREWLTSGPFQIDRSEYALGENIFIRINQMEMTEKGQIAFLRPLNDTHKSVYITIPFDGSQPSFNQYFTPDLSKSKKICSINDIVGQWTVVFRGTSYDNIEFTVLDDVVVPGEEKRYEPVC